MQGEQKIILFYWVDIWDRLENVYRRMERHRSKSKQEEKGSKLQRR